MRARTRRNVCPNLPVALRYGRGSVNVTAIRHPSMADDGGNSMLTLTEYAAHDGLGLADLVARKQVTPKELTATALQAVEKLNPKLNAVLQTLPARAEAEIAAGLPHGPFTGVPFLIKELLLHAKNVRCDMG